MHILFVTSKEERYEQFKLLVPWKTTQIIYEERENIASGRIEIVFPEDITIHLCKKSLIIIDVVSYHIKALNDIELKLINVLYDVGIDNLKKMIAIKGSRMRQKTYFRIILYNYSCIKEIRAEISGNLIIPQKEIKNFDDMFLIEDFEVPFSDIPFTEKAIVGSIGMASKYFIDWILENELSIDNKYVEETNILFEKERDDV